LFVGLPNNSVMILDFTNHY